MVRSPLPRLLHTVMDMDDIDKRFFWNDGFNSGYAYEKGIICKRLQDKTSDNEVSITYIELDDKLYCSVYVPIGHGLLYQYITNTSEIALFNDNPYFFVLPGIK